ncbi:hypothetical protein DEG02_015900 [Xanthomonas vasicola]|nr:hypothetical protein KWO_006475 [Xanthomonas vasicola pv. musacearum NCPPB 4379]KFA15104.1 hypothetical protein KWQ_0102710 [Xanthomonas vasicola pv. musacearum NCPPB 4380]KFA23359.1 hypothetical protein KWU_0107575 [Xanthomonas vasicola pv. musacearum NCPPB 4394]RJL81591.1 hypothetical protein DEG03_016745 [Xanthomonas vasicola]RRJ38713.1 hypothetical protein EIM46_14260 [Xanthomonas vasicola pv. musacearum]
MASHRHRIGSAASLLRNPAARSVAQGCAQCMAGGAALRKTCLHSRALCRLRSRDPARLRMVLFVARRQPDP